MFVFFLISNSSAMFNEYSRNLRKSSKNLYRICRDEQRGRNEEQLLALPDVLQGDEASLPYFHPLYGHLLRRESGVRQPLLQGRGVFERVDVAAPRNSAVRGGGGSGGVAGGGDGAADECGGAAGVVVRGGWVRERARRAAGGFVSWSGEVGDECGVEDSGSFGHGCRERERGLRMKTLSAEAGAWRESNRQWLAVLTVVKRRAFLAPV